MTEKEAIRRVKKLFKLYVKDEPYSEHYLYADAVKMSEEALENQTPMKPKEINEERIRLDGIWDWSCGKCGRFHRNDYPLNYCNECGQKVDWSDWN